MSSEVLVPPVAAFGAVLVRSVDGRVVALEPADGSERWSVSNTPPPLTLTGYGRPTLVAGGVLVGLDDGRRRGQPGERLVGVPEGPDEGGRRLVDDVEDRERGEAGAPVGRRFARGDRPRRLDGPDAKGRFRDRPLRTDGRRRVERLGVGPYFRRR